MLGYDEITNTIASQVTIHTEGNAFYNAVAAKFGLSHGGWLTRVGPKLTDLGLACTKVTLPILHAF